MPKKKITKRSSTKQVKTAKTTREQRKLHRHFSVTSPLGLGLALVFLMVAAAVASAGYKAITKKPAGINEVRMDAAGKREEITGVVSREQATRGAKTRYVLTTSDNTKYELIGMNAGLLERMEKKPSQPGGEKEKEVYNMVDPEEVSRRMEQKKQANEEANPTRRKVIPNRAEQTKTKPMIEAEILSKNDRIMEAYVGKTVTVMGSRVGNMPKPTPKVNQKGKIQYQSELPQFVVKTIVVAQ